jgi:hypothetical protein
MAFSSKEPEYTPTFAGFVFVRFVQVHVLTFLVPCCDVHYDFHVKRGFDRLYSLIFGGGSCFIYVICI